MGSFNVDSLDFFEKLSNSATAAVGPRRSARIAEKNSQMGSSTSAWPSWAEDTSFTTTEETAQKCAGHELRQDVTAIETAPAEQEEQGLTEETRAIFLYLEEKEKKAQEKFRLFKEKNAAVTRLYLQERAAAQKAAKEARLQAAKAQRSDIQAQIKDLQREDEKLRLEIATLQGKEKNPWHTQRIPVGINPVSYGPKRSKVDNIDSAFNALTRRAPQEVKQATICVEIAGRRPSDAKQNLETVGSTRSGAITDLQFHKGKAYVSGCERDLDKISKALQARGMKTTQARTLAPSVVKGIRRSLSKEGLPSRLKTALGQLVDNDKTATPGQDAGKTAPSENKVVAKLEIPPHL
eukprot:GHVN01001249.1.p1 GENE.GHVN01001249.1~~GHVN01001249.1.p1  ORF type:complete len:351 (+),score=7.17 GHVN01001249.1:72-1124(+)